MISYQVEDMIEEMMEKNSHLEGDDLKFMALMAVQKLLRRNPKFRDEEREVLEMAMEIAKNGNVSPDIQMGAAYL